jgi:hypothetical protein
MAVNPMMESAMSAGVRSMNAAIKGLNSAAQEIASQNATERSSVAGAPPASGDELKDRAEALTSLKLYERQVQAAARVVETADEVVGFLLDVRA